MARSNREVRYNPRTGLFEGIDITPPSQRSKSLSRRNVPSSPRNVPPARNGTRSCSCGCMILMAGFLVILAIAICGYQKDRRKTHSDDTPKTGIQKVDRQPSRVERHPKPPKINGGHPVKAVTVTHSVCERCGGDGWVCAICKGEGYVSRKCEHCQGSGEKGVISKTGETVGNILTLPFAAVGNMFGRSSEMKIVASAECPTCKGTGNIRHVCGHRRGLVICPACGK